MPTGRHLLNARDLLESAGIRRGQCVADFGCGRSGHLAFPASWMVGENGVVHAVDVNKDVLAQLAGGVPHARATNVNTVWGDIERTGGTGLEERSVDHVFCVNNLWCLQDYESVLSEMQRVLKQDGSGYLVDWHKQSRHPAAPKTEDRARLQDVRWFLDQMGIAHEEFYVSPNHWGLRLNFS